MHLLMMEFDCPEVALCSRQDVKIQLLTSSQFAKMKKELGKKRMQG